MNLEIWKLLSVANLPIKISFEILPKQCFRHLTKSKFIATITFIHSLDYLNFINLVQLNKMTIDEFDINIEFNIDTISEFNKIDLPQCTEHLEIIGQGLENFNYDCPVDLCWNNRLKILYIIGNISVNLSNLGYINTLYLKLPPNKYSLESLPETIKFLHILNPSEIDFHILPTSIEIVYDSYSPHNNDGKNIIKCYCKEKNSDLDIKWTYINKEIYYNFN